MCNLCVQQVKPIRYISTILHKHNIVYIHKNTCLFSINLHYVTLPNLVKTGYNWLLCIYVYAYIHVYMYIYIYVIDVTECNRL